MEDSQVKCAPKIKTTLEGVLWESYQLLKDNKATMANYISAHEIWEKQQRQVSLCEDFLKDTGVGVVHHCGIHCRAENTAVFLFCILSWNERNNYPRDQTKSIISHFIKH